ncbi:MAG: DMT family transporter [Bacillota bacterium]
MQPNNRSSANRNTFTGTLLALLAAVGFSTEAVLVKTGYGLGLSPLGASAWRHIIAAAVIVPVALAFGVRGWRPDRREVRTIALVGLVGNAATVYLLALSLRLVSASVGIICLFTYPAMVGLLAHPLLGERLSIRIFGAFAVSLLGVGLVVWAPGTAVNATGVFLALSAAAANAVSIVAMKGRVRETPPLISASGIIVGTALTFTSAGLATGMGPPAGPLAWLTVAALGLLTTAFPVTAFYAAVRLIPATRASMVEGLEPFLTAILAAAFLGDRLTAAQLAGGLLIVASLAISAEEPLRAPSKH